MSLNATLVTLILIKLAFNVQHHVPLAQLVKLNVQVARKVIYTEQLVLTNAHQILSNKELDALVVILTVLNATRLIKPLAIGAMKVIIFLTMFVTMDALMVTNHLLITLDVFHCKGMIQTTPMITRQS